MSTAVSTDARIKTVDVSEEMITAHLADGRIISVPLTWSWRLANATPTQRAHDEIIADGHGVHWPDVDEDISAEGMLGGSPARPPKRRALPHVPLRARDLADWPRAGADAGAIPGLPRVRCVS